MPTRPTFFPTPADFRAWLDAHHREASELLVGFHKRSSGKPSITWPESVDAALCFGWIDGVRKNLDATSYTIRFTPRKVGSIWSAINIRRAAVLIEQGAMTPAGLAAYEARRENKVGVYSYEQRSAELVEPYASLLRENEAASAFFEAQPPHYRKAASWWIISAKKEETRKKRLDQLIALSVEGKWIPALVPRKAPK
ncbi:MAG: YdeI/OmpD-associated family protein [Byssovorax sp.]